MPRVTFTSHLQGHVACPPTSVAPGQDVRAALDHIFQQYPPLRGYILDDQSRLRQHIAVFVDNQPLHDRVRLSDPVSEQTEIYVMQALSGG